MKRRTFLSTSLSAGTAALILPSNVWSGPSKNGTLQLAQIGCGRMGRGDMTNALSQGMKPELNARVVAVCDVDANRMNSARDRVEQFYKDQGEASVEVTTATNHQDLIDRKGIDGFIISTPENWHALIGVAAANAGKHMYIQKPLTYSIPEGQALVKAVRANNVIVQTGSQQRSSVYFRQVCTIIRNNWLGELKTIEVGIPTDEGRADGDPEDPPENLDYDRWLGPCPDIPYIESRVHPKNGFGRPGWLQVERHCLGMITGWGSHMYDIAQWGLGTDLDSGPVEIRAQGEFPDRGHFNVHVAYEGEATYANGVRMTSNNGAPGVKFITEDGWAYCKRGGMECSDPELLRRKPSDREVTLYQSKDHMGDFLASARAGTDPVCPVEVGHRSNTVCVLHHASMKLNGKTISWNPETETASGAPGLQDLIDVPMRKPYVL